MLGVSAPRDEKFHENSQSGMELAKSCLKRKWLSCLDVNSNQVFQASKNGELREFPLAKNS